MPGGSAENLGVGIQQERPDRGIFGNSPSPEARFIRDHEILDQYVEAIKTLGLSVALTSGTYDLLHIGHMRYLEQAKKCADVLIVGVDSDAKVKARKGPDRPVVSEIERVDSLAHLRSVDLITLKDPDEPKWGLIKRVHPDTLITTRETYDDATLEELGEFCGRIVCLEPQAETSTSARVRLLHVGWGKKVMDPVERILDEYSAPEELRRAIGKVLLSLTENER
jgi:D-beta-D-heptose 7-phosphate kinase/D-beta-D-heptose 1-phosphate adenosyltransferase